MMIYLYDFASKTRFDDSEKNVYLGGIDAPPKDMEHAEQFILDMLEYESKVQYWLMDNKYNSNYRVITKNASRYFNGVPKNKIIELKE